MAIVEDIFDPLPAPKAPKGEAIEYAGSLVEELPDNVRSAARNPADVRAVVHCLLLDPDGEDRVGQLDRLRPHTDPACYEKTLKLMLSINGLGVAYRLPLIDLAVPALKKFSGKQYVAFKQGVIALAEGSATVDPMTWALKTVLLNHLESHFVRPLPPGGPPLRLDTVGQELSLMLSALAHAGNEAQESVEGSFAAAKNILKLGALRLMAKGEIAAPELDRAVARLARLNSLAKTNLLRACGHAVLQDKEITPQELELIRAVSGALDCPIPPIVPADTPEQAPAP